MGQKILRFGTKLSIGQAKSRKLWAIFCSLAHLWPSFKIKVAREKALIYQVFWLLGQLPTYFTQLFIEKLNLYKTVERGVKNGLLDHNYIFGVF